MFLPEKMVELHILTLESYVKEMSDFLMKFGEFELKNVRVKEVEKLLSLGKNKSQDSERFSQLKLRLDKLSVAMNIDEEKIKETTQYREPLSLDDIDRILAKIENEFYSSKSFLDALENEEFDLRLKKLKYEIRNQIKDGKIASNGFFTSLIVIPKYEFVPISKIISSIPSFAEKIEQFGDNVIVLISVPSSYKSEILKLSASFIKFFEISEFLKEDVDIDEINKELNEIGFEKKKLNKVIEKIIEADTEEILTLYKGLWFNESAIRLKSYSVRGGNFILFSGWIPKKRLNEILKKIEEITQGLSVIEFKEAQEVVKEDKNVSVPTKLDNPRMFSSFESIVKLYAIPRFYEIDPTIIFTLLYVLFYGMMFGDVGQGLALSLLSLLLFWKFKNFRVIAGLGIAVGLSAAFFGLLYGSVFGIEEKIIPHLWTSPLHDVITLLKVSMVIGFVVILLGLILNTINTIVEGNIVKLILGSKGLAGIIFYISLIGYPLYVIFFGGKFNGNIMLVGVLVPIFMFIVESIIEAKRHGHEVSAVSVFFELFEIFLSFVSNTVSFIRIMGFALNHTALMITFFSIANIFKGSLLGDILAFIVVVIGQIFIIVFEGFIVGIQALRLSFYEFFTKFFRGGGKAFEPLK
ncbi:MAG: V-type ATP synthase subunit I [Brevinematia bacterium]